MLRGQTTDTIRVLRHPTLSIIFLANFFDQIKPRFFFSKYVTYVVYFFIGCFVVYLIYTTLTEPRTGREGDRRGGKSNQKFDSKNLFIYFQEVADLITVRDRASVLRRHRRHQATTKRLAQKQAVPETVPDSIPGWDWERLAVICLVIEIPDTDIVVAVLCITIMMDRRQALDIEKGVTEAALVHLRRTLRRVGCFFLKFLFPVSTPFFVSRLWRHE